MIEKTGIPSAEQVLEKFPDTARINRGRVAVVECYQCIPCNPCEKSCIFGAIRVGEDINNTPVIDFAKCVGCGACLARCPGLAIMLVDGTKGEDIVEMSIPYEFLPLPAVGSEVSALDRSGKRVATGRVTHVMNPQNYDRTPIVRFTVPRDMLYIVRNIAVEGK